MALLLVIGGIWVLYGIAGFFGIQRVPEMFKGKTWTKDYIRKQGISWIMIGVAWIVCFFIVTNVEMYDSFKIYLLVLLSCPSFVVTYRTNKKYREMVEKNR